MSDKPYRVIARLKNNRLWSSVLACFPDVKYQTDAARRLGISPAEFWRLLSMKWWPQRLDGEWSPIAKKIARTLRVPEDYLFDGELYGRIPAARVELEMGPSELEAFGMLALPAGPDEILEARELEAAVTDGVKSLGPRPAEVLRLRFGLDGGGEHSLAEVGDIFGVGGERIRQIEKKALRRLRHHTRAKRLREFLE